MLVPQGALGFRTMDSAHRCGGAAPVGRSARLGGTVVGKPGWGGTGEWEPQASWGRGSTGTPHRVPRPFPSADEGQASSL